MAAREATAGGGLREEIVGFLFERYSSGGLMELRGCQADADDLLALPALRDVLAAAARDAEAVRRVRDLADELDREIVAAGFVLDRIVPPGDRIRRALDGTL